MFFERIGASMGHPPFAHLNLCRNPFGQLSGEELGRVAVVDLDAHRRHLLRGAAAVEFVGTCGRGKTTHLMALKAALGDAAYVEVERDAELSRLPSADVFLLDEYQFLDPAGRRRVAREFNALAIGTHTSVADELARRGFDVRTVEVGRLGVVELREMVRARIESARRGPGPVPSVAPQLLERLVEAYGSDLRALQHHLYELFQKLEEPRTLLAEEFERVEYRPDPSRAGSWVEADGRSRDWWPW